MGAPTPLLADVVCLWCGEHLSILTGWRCSCTGAYAARDRTVNEQLELVWSKARSHHPSNSKPWASRKGPRKDTSDDS